MAGFPIADFLVAEIGAGVAGAWAGCGHNARGVVRRRLRTLRVRPAIISEEVCLHRLILGIALTAVAWQPAPRIWVRCVAMGTGGRRKGGYFTTIADVGALPPGRVGALQQRLTAYVSKTEPTVSGVTSQCFSFSEEVDAGAHYSRLLNNQARVLGWDKTVVLQPQDWLPLSDTGSDMLHP